MSESSKTLRVAVVEYVKAHRKTLIELAAGFVAGLVVGIWIS